MCLLNISKDTVFYYLNQEHEVYAFDYKDEDVLNLKYETVNDILSMLKDERHLYFIVEKEDEDK